MAGDGNNDVSCGRPLGICQVHEIRAGGSKTDAGIIRAGPIRGATIVGVRVDEAAGNVEKNERRGSLATGDCDNGRKPRRADPDQAGIRRERWQHGG